MSANPNFTLDRKYRIIVVRIRPGLPWQFRDNCRVVSWTKPLLGTHMRGDRDLVEADLVGRLLALGELVLVPGIPLKTLF